ncbi:restriction endonuclease subunit S [Lactococcus cremoris]|uniref:restriction endonuclease subunit S n=1 Tax=Lactococcus lactis subsp. cremoris TaxID=1359 RepID=UPI0024A63A36|nr:restriction endonuclease subunit S [Lactococcus cremoris]
MKERLKAPELRFPGFTDDWEERKLEKVFDTITDYVANGSFESLRKNVNSSDINGFAYLVRLQDASNNWQGPWLYTDQHGYEFLKKSRLQPDDIIMANVGSVGKFFLVPKLDKPMTLAPNAVLIKSSENDQGFLYQMMLTPEMQYKIFEKTTPGVQSKINKTDFKMIETRLPNMDEQKKIGAFFKQLDDTIALHQRKLDLLKEQKKGYLQKMFPKNGAKVPELRFAGFADDWEERKLIDVKDNEDRYSYTGGPFGSDLKSSDYTEIGVRIIQLQNIGDGKFVNDYKIYTSEEKARSLNSNLIYPGEIIIAKMADPLARATILPKIEPKYLMASDGIRLKISTDYFDNYYILTLINSDVFRKEALNNSTGTTRKRIGLVTLGNLPMMIPSFEEQQKIGSFFKQLDETIALHQRKLDLLKEQKKGFLQKMFV